MNRIIDVATSFLASGARLAFAERVYPLGARPAQPLELYDFEACPYCRKVREALTVLDLTAVVYPCPKGGPRYRPAVRERGGKEQFPYLVDPNTGRAMYESSVIVRYLCETYGTGAVPWLLSLPVAGTVSSAIASSVRPTRGLRYRPSCAPARPLELYSYEGSPFCRIARERLCEREIPYLLHNVAQGSPGREAFVARSGRMMVPYLVDPNTGAEMFESSAIADYLDQTYAAAA
jgi:glutathione S-transferase